jgi:alcohol dehydrogenase YqhD (iron-dependent ADH family)
MNNFNYFAPTEVRFGRDVELETGEVAKKYGSRAVLVFGKNSVRNSGLLDRVEKSLQDAGVEFVEFGGAKPNPTVEHAEEGVKLALDSKADLIIALGGGSAIDTAKAIAHGTANPEADLWDIWTKKVPLTKTMPVGAVLTIPAAGSEMSDSAVLTNEALGKKGGINTDFNRCRFAIMNPALAATLPKKQISAGVTDIMMHTMERYFIPDIQCELTDELAEGLLRTVIKNGAKVYADPSDYDAMAEIYWASSLSHNNLMECGRGKDFSVHKIGHALSAKYDFTHGESLSAVWNAWAHTLYKDGVDRFARFARKVWGVNEQDDEKAAALGIEWTVDFFKSLNMPVTISDLGVRPTNEEIRALALDATANDQMKLSRIRPLDAKAVEEIYKAAL